MVVGDLPWDAIATVVVGLPAVIFASLIGRKQNKILDSQNRLSDTNLRINLLDRRSACIAKMRRIHGEWISNARLSQESWNEFREVFWESELVFSEALSHELDQSLGSLFFSEIWQKRSIYYHSKGLTEKAEEKLELSFKEDDKVFKIMPHILNKMIAEARASAPKMAKNNAPTFS